MHDRSPVVLPASLQDAWLDPNRTDRGEVEDLLSRVPDPRLRPYQVSTAVNSSRNNRPELLEPVAAE